MAKQLCGILEEAQQPVPPELRQFAMTSGGPSSFRSRGGGGRGGGSRGGGGFGGGGFTGSNALPVGARGGGGYGGSGGYGGGGQQRGQQGGRRYSHDCYDEDYEGRYQRSYGGGGSGGKRPRR